MAGTLMDIHEHGFCVNKKKGRVKCIYCGKEMNSFTRLKYHLGGVRKDVLPCELVTDTVRETFRNMILKDKPGLLAPKRVGEVLMGNLHKCARIEDSSIKNVSDDKQDLLSNKSQKSIARFFYENYIEFSVVDSLGFKEMMNVGGGGGQMGLKFPDSHELNGRMLQETLKEVQDHVKKIKDTWKITGCSILLDAWVDEKGHDLVTFVADSPAGPVYLRSFDVSDIKADVTALLSLVDELIEEVGVHNVTQIIACPHSGWVGELGKLFVSKKRQVFWSVSLSHCIELMLEKIGEITNFGEILGKVSKIWEFIENNPSVLKIFRDYSDRAADMIVSSSEFEFLTPYLTLERVFNAKNILVFVFASSKWNKEEEGITISKLVNDSCFWEALERVVKYTSSLVHGLLGFSNTNNQQVGCIYDTMDCIKESIAREFKNEKLSYKPIWDVIDNVWNKHLHSPLHAAGYFLNPASFYSADFHLDPEVATGLLSLLVLMVKESHIQTKIGTQLDVYRQGKGCYKEASQDDQIDGFTPVEWWWAQKASQHPELQSFAIKILSQTCEGASKYKLKRSLAEKLLLAQGIMSRCEQRHLEDLAFVHYNLHLQSSVKRMCCKMFIRTD